MVYRVIGLMSGRSPDGLDIAFIEFHESAGNWSYTTPHASSYEYPPEWIEKLRRAAGLSALDYQLLHAEYGHYLGELVNGFIDEHDIHYQVQLIASHGHPAFHMPGQKMTAQLGDGAAIAAVTGINVVSDLRSIDVALGGQGGPLSPLGEQLLFSDYVFFLNLADNAHISFNDLVDYTGFDVCPANTILDLLAGEGGKNFDDGGQIAEKGSVVDSLLNTLNDLAYYSLPFPKSWPAGFADQVYALIREKGGDYDNDLCTYVEHICEQVARAVESLQSEFRLRTLSRQGNQKMLVTGGGAKNTFLMSRLDFLLSRLNVTIEVPDAGLTDFKDAIVIGLLGVLRWREENNLLASATGASRNSIGGAVWMGQEA